MSVISTSTSMPPNPFVITLPSHSNSHVEPILAILANTQVGIENGNSVSVGMFCSCLDVSFGEAPFGEFANVIQPIVLICRFEF